MAIPPNCPGESWRAGNRSRGSAGQEPCQEEQQEDGSCPSVRSCFRHTVCDMEVVGVAVIMYIWLLQITQILAWQTVTLPSKALTSIMNWCLSWDLFVAWYFLSSGSVLWWKALSYSWCSAPSAPLWQTPPIHIEPNFHYHISIQGQPLLPTHRLYDSHPSRLTTTKEIVALLEDLERYSVCLGSGHKKSTTGSEPVVPERAATCDFLVFSETEHCEQCKTLQKV